MKLKIIKDNIIFYVAFVLYYISIFVTYIPFEKAGTLKILLALFTCLCLAINLIPKIMIRIKFKYIKKKRILVVMCVAIGAVLLKDFFVIVIYLFGVNIYLRIKDLKPLFKISFYLLLIITIVTILLCMIGVINNVVTARNGVQRYSLGFYHSNVLPQIILYLCIYYHIFKKNITLVSFTVFEVVSILAYIICNSRNAFFAIQVLLIIFIIVKKYRCNRRYIKLLKLIAISSPIIIAIISLLLLYLYSINSSIAITFNDFFNNRIHMCWLYYQYQEIKVINFMTTEYFQKIILTLDNGYYYSIARYGVIILVPIFMIFISITKGAYKRNNGYYLAAIIVLSAVNFIDNGFFSFIFYPFIIEAIYYFKYRNSYKDADILYIIEQNI